MNNQSGDHLINRTVLVGWQNQLAQAAKKPWLASFLLRHGGRLLRRFVSFYQRLCALPRAKRRTLARKLSLPLAGMALMLALSQASTVHAATIWVNSTSTTVDSDDGKCTLVEAILAANNDTASGTKTGECAAGNGADMIELPTNKTIKLTSVNNSTFGPTGLPVITSKITIEGNGTKIEGTGPNFRILAIASNGNLTLNNSIITGGVLLPDDRPNNNGAGVANYQGTVAINNSKIKFNTSGAYTSHHVFSGHGGGIYNQQGTMTISNTTISHNTAARGGGIYNQGGDGNATLDINFSTINFNHAVQGAGIHNDGQNGNATLNIHNSTIRDNSAYSSYDPLVGVKARGGGIANEGYEGIAKTTIINSTISGNHAVDNGGGMSNFSNYGSATITTYNSTISNNTTEDKGGGISSIGNYNVEDYGTAGNIRLVNTTITGNHSNGAGGGAFLQYTTTFVLKRSLVSGNRVAGNPASGGGEVYNFQPDIVPVGGMFNVFGDDDLTNQKAFHNFNPASSDITATSDGSTPTPLGNILDSNLANNGGIPTGRDGNDPLLTHALILDSPAVDAGNTEEDCGEIVPSLLFDQRGVLRNGSCDIGAYELVQIALSNGSFEIGNCTSPTNCTVDVDSTTIAGWDIVSGNVDYITGLWEASDGDRSVDLSGNRAGAIAQTIQTIPGASYKVVFDMAGNPDGGSNIKRLEVTAGSTTEVRTFNTSGKTREAMGWEQRSFSFTATDTTTTLRFATADGESDFGPVIDNIRIVEGATTAINLTSFKAIIGEIAVDLTWQTAREIDNEGFNLWRSETENGSYVKINDLLIPAEGNTDTGASYEYTDPNVSKDKTYFYKLEDVDANGTSTFHGPVSALVTASKFDQIYLPLIFK